jgi:hypothetical protein
MGACDACVEVEEGRDKLWPNIDGGGSGEGALVSLDKCVPLVNLSNSPSLMGTDAGRRIGSTGGALNNMGANAEAVLKVVETNVVSDESLEKADH